MMTSCCIDERQVSHAGGDNLRWRRFAGAACSSSLFGISLLRTEIGAAALEAMRCVWWNFLRFVLLLLEMLASACRCSEIVAYLDLKSFHPSRCPPTSTCPGVAGCNEAVLLDTEPSLLGSAGWDRPFPLRGDLFLFLPSALSP